MKNTILLIIFILVSFSVNAQELRGLRPFTEAERIKTSQIPEYKVQNSRAPKAYPKFVDNSVSKYFPKIFTQIGNCCAQASSIRYMFTYEINALRGKSAEDINNVYSSQYTWHFLNYGINLGSYYWDGLEIAKDNGIPNLKTFNDNIVGLYKYMNGYESYYKAMHNRVKEYYRIKSDTDEGISQMKQYLYDKGNGSQHGGLLIFAAMTMGWDVVDYTKGNETQYKTILRECAEYGPHAMTIVGYDDSIDTGYSSERGAFICVNSWGENWGDRGRFYLPYRLFKLPQIYGGTGNGEKYVYGCSVKEGDPKLTFKVKLKHSSRDDFKIRIGVTNNEYALEPTFVKELKIFNHHGGNKPFGYNWFEEEFEFGVDATDLLQYIKGDSQSFFFELLDGIPKKCGDITADQYRGVKGKGDLISCIMLDYRNDKNNPVEYLAERHMVEMAQGQSIKLKVSTGIKKLHDVGESDLISIATAPYVLDGEYLIYFNLPSNQLVRVELIGTDGVVVRYFFEKEMKAGNHSESLRIKDLKAGNYAIRIVTDYQVVYKKLQIN